jgi:hypothetical protein
MILILSKADIIRSKEAETLIVLQEIREVMIEEIVLKKGLVADKEDLILTGMIIIRHGMAVMLLEMMVSLLETVVKEEDMMVVTLMIGMRKGHVLMTGKKEDHVMMIEKREDHVMMIVMNLMEVDLMMDITEVEMKANSITTPGMIDTLLGHHMMIMKGTEDVTMIAMHLMSHVVITRSLMNPVYQGKEKLSQLMSPLLRPLVFSV